MSNAVYTQFDARVLVVDDDAPARQLVRKYLASRGATVFEAEIDLVITDLNMPGRSGMWLIEEARTRFPDLPIIVTTGEDAGIRAFAEMLPSVTVIRKPYSLQDLGKAIDEMIRPSSINNS